MTRLGLTLPMLEQLLQKYRGLQHFFPFVRIPPEWTAKTMLELRPFLLLCTVTVVASRDARTQARLAEEVRTTLARRFVTDGENSFDILQGLLVYLAW